MNSTNHQSCCREVEDEAGPSDRTSADTNANITHSRNNDCKGAIPKTKPAVKIKSSNSKKTIKFNNNIEELPSITSSVHKDILQVNGVPFNMNFTSARKKDSDSLLSLTKSDKVNDHKSNSPIKCDTLASSISVGNCNGKNKDVKFKYCQFSDEDDEDALSISDDGCIYTYKGDQDADLPISFFSLDMPAESPNPINRIQSASPEMDFLEMDFDPGPCSELDYENTANNDIKVEKCATPEQECKECPSDNLSKIHLSDLACNSATKDESVKHQVEHSKVKRKDSNHVSINKKNNDSKCKIKESQNNEVKLEMPWTCNVADRTTASADIIFTTKYHYFQGDLVSPVDNPQKNAGTQSSALCNNAYVDCYSIDTLGSQDVNAVIWTEQEAYLKQTTQIGPSACGATAVLNVLNALKIPNPSPEKINSYINTKLRANSSPLKEYLLSRSVAGTTHKDIINCLHKVTDGQVYARFFHMYPERVVNLRSWLAFWISKGAVPIATLNLQKCTTGAIPDAWHHQMIFGVNAKGVYLCNPVECVAPELLWPQLCSESILLVRREDVLNRFNIKVDLPELMNIKNQRWRTLNVVGRC